MRCCGYEGGASLEEDGPEVYAGKHQQKCNKKVSREVSTYKLTRLVESAYMC